LIKDWGNNTVDIYSKFDEDKDKKTITMSVAVDLGGTYLKSSDKDKYKYMEKIVKEFAVKMTKDGIEDKVKEASGALSKLESNQKDLESKNSSLKKDIENYKEKIKKAEEDVKTNEADQVKKKSEIEAQKKVVEEIKKKLSGVN
jgi:chromosome segregation ATPase